jgi:hypothetical protein
MSIMEPEAVVEKRRAARIAAALLPSITGLRLSPCGGKTLLVNLSGSGAAVKSDTKQLLGTVVTMNLEGTFSPSSIKGKVVRCGVTAIDSGVIWYQLGILFNDPISIEQHVGHVERVEHVEPVAQAEPVWAPPPPLEAPARLSNRW